MQTKEKITYLEKKQLTPPELEQAKKDTELLLAWGLPILGIAFILMLILVIRKLLQ
jgi:flagellar biogenesis protein FliO